MRGLEYRSQNQTVKLLLVVGVCTEIKGETHSEASG